MLRLDKNENRELQPADLRRVSRHRRSDCAVPAPSLALAPPGAREKDAQVLRTQDLPKTSPRAGGQCSQGILLSGQTGPEEAVMRGSGASSVLELPTGLFFGHLTCVTDLSYIYSHEEVLDGSTREAPGGFARKHLPLDARRQDQSRPNPSQGRRRFRRSAAVDRARCRQHQKIHDGKLQQGPRPKTQAEAITQAGQASAETPT